MRKIENDVQGLSSGKSTQGRGGLETWRCGIETELTFYTASGKLEPRFFFLNCPVLSNLATTRFH